VPILIGASFYSGSGRCVQKKEEEKHQNPGVVKESVTKQRQGSATGGGCSCGVREPRRHPTGMEGKGNWATWGKNGIVGHAERCVENGYGHSIGKTFVSS